MTTALNPKDSGSACQRQRTYTNNMSCPFATPTKERHIENKSIKYRVKLPAGPLFYFEIS